MVKTSNFPGLFGIGCSIPFAIKAVKHLIFALQPNAATGMPRAIVFDVKVEEGFASSSEGKITPGEEDSEWGN